MNRSGTADLRAATAVEVTKDRNGVDQVVLRNRRGASARVSPTASCSCLLVNLICLSLEMTAMIQSDGNYLS
jgi:hypothetical protein